MTTKISIVFIIMLTLAACNNSRSQDKPKQETPKALESPAAYYLLLLRATRQLYYTTYQDKNHQLLQTLRSEYHFEYQFTGKH